jgi:palmitoyltransferase
MSSSTSGGQSNGTSPPNPGMQTISMNGKASAAPPQPTTDGVELKNMTASNGNGNENAAGETGKPPLPIESDIMQLARLGEIAAMQKLFDTKKFNAKHKDEEGITPLHVSQAAFLA